MLEARLDGVERDLLVYDLGGITEVEVVTVMKIKTRSNERRA